MEYFSRNKHISVPNPNACTILGVTSIDGIFYSGHHPLTQSNQKISPEDSTWGWGYHREDASNEHQRKGQRRHHHRDEGPRRAPPPHPAHGQVRLALQRDRQAPA